MENLKLVMLPTEKASGLGFFTAFYTQLYIDPPIQCYDYQHLYLIDTKATIQEDDWMMSYGALLQCDDFDVLHVNQDPKSSKVIATTNTSTKLPSIPKKLIQLFVENYNKGIELSSEDISKCYSQTNEDKSVKVENKSHSILRNKPQVNFELLDWDDYMCLQEKVQNLEEIVYGEEDESYQDDLDSVNQEISEVEDNFALFFKIISESSSFAHKAHKELKFLNQKR